MDRITAIRSFVRAVETGSFTAVALEFGTSQPAVSKRIAWLEGEVGARLLERSTRTLALTDAGRRFLAYCHQLLQTLDDAENCIDDSREALCGSLRISAPVAFGRLELISRLRDFKAEYPGIEIDLHLDDRFEDLSREGIDLAVRLGHLQDPNLIAQELGTTPRVLVASPDYLLRHGAPARLDDLAGHACVVYGGHRKAGVWAFPEGASTRTIGVTGSFRSDSSEGVLGAIMDGLGIGYVPLRYVDRDLQAGRLLPLLQQIPTELLPIRAVKPASRRRSARVAALVAFLRRQLCHARGATLN